MGTRVYLGKEDVCIKLKKNGTVGLSFPKLDDNECVPEHTLFMIVIGILIQLKDKEFEEYIWKRWDEMTEKYGDFTEELMVMNNWRK